MKYFLPILLALSLLAAACGRQEQTVAIGSKNYSENKILAEMFALLLTQEGIEVKKQIPYGNTFDLQKGMQEGKVEIYPEYTGTGIALAGMTAPSKAEESLAMAREQYRTYGMTWLEALGFNNSYVLLMEQGVATRLNITRISDLVRQQESFRISMHREFKARPVDGFLPLVRRYGIAPQPEPLSFESIKEVYLALVTEQCMVAVGQKTDPQIEEFNLRILEDDLNFFPAYEAAPLVLEEVLRKHPNVEEILGGLAGRLTADRMRDLNRQVDSFGMDPESVAARFLVEEKLLPASIVQDQKKEMVMAIPPISYRSSLAAKSLNALRETFPKRKISLQEFDDPVAAVIAGNALVAMLGAEHFYMPAPGRLPVLEEGIEAITPLGYNVVHLIRPRRHLEKKSLQGIGKLGVGPENGSAAKTARFIIDAYNSTDRIKLVTGDFKTQLKEVAQGKLDALLAVDPIGEATLVLALANNPELALQPLEKWGTEGRRYRYPFFREVRIPGNAYTGMRGSVETVATQVVLTGPDPETGGLGNGPVSGMRTRVDAIPRRYKQQMADSLDFADPLDPVLPGERLDQLTARGDQQPISPNPGVSAVTALLFILLGLLVYVLFGRRQNGKIS